MALGDIAASVRTAFRKYVTDGVAASGPHQPVKDEIFVAGDTIEARVTAIEQLAAVGLSRLAPVLVATTADGAFASAFDAGSAVDGVTLATGDRILLKNQAAGATNGVYVAQASGAPVRAADADSADEIGSGTVYVQAGTSNGGKTFACQQIDVNITLGTTPLTFVEVANEDSLNPRLDLAEQEIDDLQAAVAQETADRIAADTAEATLRADADTAEATARAAADALLAPLHLIEGGGVQYLGVATAAPGAPSAGSNLNNVVFMADAALLYDGMVFPDWADMSGTGGILVDIIDWNASTSTATLVSTKSYTSVAGINNFAAAGVEGQMGRAGQRVAVYGTNVRYLAGPGWAYRDNVTSGAGRTYPFTDAGATASPNIQIRFRQEQAGLADQVYEDAARITALEDAQTAAAAPGGRYRKAIDPSSLMASASLLGFVQYGQSNAVGADIVTPISTAASAYHWTCGKGPKTVKTGLSGTVAGVNVAAEHDGTFAHLVENTQAPLTGNSYGETPGSGVSRSYANRRLAEGGAQPVLFYGAAGKSGTTLSGLVPGSTWYPNLTDWFARGVACASANGLAHKVGAIGFDHGESDAQAGTTKATYKGTTSTGAWGLFNAINTDAAAATGQTERVHILFTTNQWQMTAGANSPGPALAMLELADEQPFVHFVAPNYLFGQGPNNTHLSAINQRLKGEYYGRAMHHLSEGYVPDRVRWVSARAVGLTLVAVLSAPTAIRFDSYLGTTTNNGLKVLDGTGTLTLSNIAIGRSWFDPDQGVLTEVSMTLHRALGASPKLRYALDYNNAGSPVTGGAGGNICDSTADTTVISGTTYTMAHYAPPCELTVKISEG